MCCEQQPPTDIKLFTNKACERFAWFYLMCVYGDRPRHRLLLLRSHCVLDVISNVSHSVYLVLLHVCLISGVLYVGIPASYSYTPPPFIYQTCLFSTDDHLMMVATTSRLYMFTAASSSLYSAKSPLGHLYFPMSFCGVVDLTN